MLYSVEDKVNPPRRDEQRPTLRDSINNDLEGEVNGDFLQYNNSNTSATKLVSEIPNGRYNENESYNNTPLRPTEPEYQPKEDLNGDNTVLKLSPAHTRKSTRTKLSTVSKDQRSRLSRRRGSTGHLRTTQKSGPVSIAMQVLNMDEEEKE